MSEQVRILDGHLHLGGADDMPIHIGDKASEPIGLHGAQPSAQKASADQDAPVAYVTGAFGLNSDVNAEAFYDLVVEMRAVLVEKGIMKGSV